MNKSVLALMVMVLLSCVGGESQAGMGSSFGCLTTARTLPTGAGLAGLGVGITDGHRNSVAGSLSYGLSDYIDGTIKMGLSDADKVRATVGVELKYQFLNAGPALNDPLDLAAGMFAEYLKDTYQIGLSLTGSRSFALGAAQLLSPYVRFSMRVEGYSGKSEIELGFHGGVRWGVTENISIFGELQLDGNEGIFIGLKDTIF